MASDARAQTFPRSSSRAKISRLGVMRVLFMAFFHTTHANKQAFVQSDTFLEVLHFGGLLQTGSDIDLSSFHKKSGSPHRGNFRPIRFEPPMLDFHEQPVGMPKMEKVYLHNPSSEEISLISISATTVHFHTSFFQNRVIPPGGSTLFDVMFLARVVGNVENTLFINTSHHGVFTYQVFGVGIPNPYRLRPFIGARVPVNSSFSPLINIHNPHSEPLQVVEMYSSGGDLHLELPTGQPGGAKRLWEIPPFETKGVMRASFSSRDADNHTAFIRIKTNSSNEQEFIILPVEVEVTSAPGIYSSTEMLDFGTLRSQDRPKQLNLHLLNSGTKDVPITSVRPTPSNEAVTLDFKPVTLKAGERKYTKVASIHFDPSKAQRLDQFSGKITVKAKEKSYSKLEIPFQAEVLEGYLGFDQTATLFHIRDSPVEPLLRPVHLTNTFAFAVSVLNVSLPDEAKTMFTVQNLSAPVLIPRHQSRPVFSLLFRPVRPSIHIDGNILLVTNASRFHLPIRAYTGFLEPLVLQPSLRDNLLDFGVLSAEHTSSLVFVLVNSNPIELEVKSWLVTGEDVNVELLRTERGNRTVALGQVRVLQNASASQHTTVILASGYYAAFRVTLVPKALKGAYDGAVHITTDYEILTIPVKAVVAVGSLSCSPKHIVLPASFPEKVVHQSLAVLSSFSQRVRLEQIRALTEDVRFYYKRLRNARDQLEPKHKSKIANIYFDARLQCGDHCYVGLPFVLKSESRPLGLAMQEDMWDWDVDLHQTLLRRWRELKESSGHEVEALFQVDMDLQKNVLARVTARLTWPSLLNSSRQIWFPLTNTHGSSEERVELENPADVPVFVQVLPLALYPNPSTLAGNLADRLPKGMLSNLNTDTLEFQVKTNLTSSAQGSSGFTEGSAQPFVYSLLLLPGEVRSFPVTFSPISNHMVSSLLIVRNNLTVLDVIAVHGQATPESLRVAGKSPGSLRFRMTESLLRDCTDKIKGREPSFSLRRSVKVENAGLLPLHVLSLHISGRPCQGYGFKVLGCQPFTLNPNASRELVILFTPDFTSWRVTQELRLVTAGGSECVLVLNASLPSHMLPACAEMLPRPGWEQELYIIVAFIMSSMFLLVIASAYLEAQGIWEPFKRHLSLESNTSMETGKPFDLREIVRIQSDGNLSEYSDAQVNPTRGIYGVKGAAARVGGRHGNGRAPPEPEGLRSRAGYGRSSMLAPSPHHARGGSEGAQSQAPGRKTRPSRSPLEPHGPAAPPQPHRGPCAEDTEYSGLLVDLERPALEPLQEQEQPQAVHSRVPEIKGKLRGKSKAQRRREEKERRAKGRAQGEAQDDTSSTTTETSNPDVESSLKEEPVKKKGRTAGLEKEKEEPPSFLAKSKSKKQGPSRKENQAEKSSTLELPYVTPLENKQRKSFSSKAPTLPSFTGFHRPRGPLKSERESPPCEQASLAGPAGKVDGCRPPPLVNLLFSGSVPELSHSSSVGGEPAPPERDVPLYKTLSHADSLQQISLQTTHSDPFLKRPFPSVSSYSHLAPGGTHRASVDTSSESSLKKAPGNHLSPSSSFPGQNGNPTFAAVAAGYDRSPGGRSDAQVKVPLPHTASVESESSDSSGVWSPTDSTSNPVNPFSAFGLNNPFNLTRAVFGGASYPKATEPQQSWPAELSPVSSSIWDFPSAPSSPSTSILGSPVSPWSSTGPFSSSIWSTSADPSLHSYAPPPGAPLTEPGSPPPPTDMSQTYNPWSMWSLPLSRRSSEPWPNPPDHGN